MDSWDLENLKYLRKISRCKEVLNLNQDVSLLDSSFCETYLSTSANNESIHQPSMLIESCSDSTNSYLLHLPERKTSFHFELNEPAVPQIEFLDGNSVDLKLKSISGQRNSESRAVEFLVTRQKDRNDFDEINVSIGELVSHCGNTKVNRLSTIVQSECSEIYCDEGNEDGPTSLLIRPLDKCCQLDVLTVRNESVFAERPTNIEPGHVQVGSSSGYASSGFEEGDMSASSSKSSLLDSPSSLRSRSTSSECSSRKGSNATSKQCEVYPDHVPKRKHSNLKKYFYLGQNEIAHQNIGKFEKEDADIPEAEESAIIDIVERSNCGNCNGNLSHGQSSSKPVSPKAKIPRTNHSNTTTIQQRPDLGMSFAPAFCPPRNFGMDKQGQLLIDYSPNWIGLEKCIEKMRLSCIHT